ncbi:glycosyltransferase family 2 protein [Mesohalobacter halotolerans]|uniref:glycosyltransferase family 2 protein n=1 Tax=Mesohalobacter halotolerans TaxID=1883405 RepID=UPI00148736DA|nr:glycosyltransferase family 2 protein [Mesohalobacter halotolerans]MBS3738754.1 glycosyltransferase family 2 protein [Psychroflexus sp.]
MSIIIPTYNRAHLIGETLDSVLAQTYQNWECIILDDGSTDNTDDVVGEYVLKDPRFKYYHRPDEHLPGGNGARNFGFKMSKGDYVNWLDSDDLFSENKIEEQLKLIIGESKTVSTCRWGRFENKNNFSLKELKFNRLPRLKIEARSDVDIKLLSHRAILTGEAGRFFECNGKNLYRDVIYI